jgi:hypothetical protein
MRVRRPFVRSCARGLLKSSRKVLDDPSMFLAMLIPIDVRQIKSSLHEFGIHLFLRLYVPVGVFFLFEFCDVVTVATIHKRKEPNVATML